MTTYVIAGTFLNPSGVGQDGAWVSVWKASRFSGVPALNASPPGGIADATGTTSYTNGSTGAFRVAAPTCEPYYVQIAYGGTNYWQYQNPEPGFDPGTQVFDPRAYGVLGTSNDTATFQSTVNAALAGGEVYVPPGTFWVDGSLNITNATGPVSIVGPGTLKLVAAAANLSALVKVVNSPNVTVSCGLDQNGTNQTATYVYGVFYDTASAHLTVRNCNIVNAWGFTVMTNGGGPSARTMDVNVYENNVTCMTGCVHDVLVLVATGGSCYGNKIMNAGAAANINIYESDDVPTWGNTVFGINAGGVGIAVSSSMGCPTFGNTLIAGGNNDLGIQIMQESDNGASARVQVDGLIANNIFSGGQAITLGSSAATHNNLSVVTVGGNVFESCFAEIIYNYNAVVSDVLVQGNHSASVGGGGHFVLNSTPTNEVRRNNQGYNPVGAVTVAVPATTVAVAAVPYDRTFYITTTAAATVAIQSGPTITLPTAGVVAVRVPAGKTLTPTYSSTAPTWVVEGE